MDADNQCADWHHGRADRSRLPLQARSLRPIGHFGDLVTGVSFCPGHIAECGITFTIIFLWHLHRAAASLSSAPPPEEHGGGNDDDTMLLAKIPFWERVGRNQRLSSRRPTWFDRKR